MKAFRGTGLPLSADHIFAGKTLKELGEIKDQDFILREKGSAGREIFDGLAASQELAITPIWQSASNQAIIHGVKEGLGISILPYFLVQESLERGETAEFKIKGLTLNRKFSVIYHRNKFLPKSAMALMDLCKGNA